MYILFTVDLNMATHTNIKYIFDKKLINPRTHVNVWNSNFHASFFSAAISSVLVTFIQFHQQCGWAESAELHQCKCQGSLVLLSLYQQLVCCFHGVQATLDLIWWLKVWCTSTEKSIFQKKNMLGIGHIWRSRSDDWRMAKKYTCNIIMISAKG